MNKDINSPGANDNRNYDYSGAETEYRAEYELIADAVAPGSAVLDLGCGNGSLLALLRNKKQAQCTGIELSPSGVAAAKNKGLNVSEGRIDEVLPFPDTAFDYAVCNVTIQMVMYPEILLSEMKRVSRYQIISFPNFGFYRNRLDLLVNGRMPAPMLFGYSWFSTGHIHQLSINDFYQLIKTVGGLSVKSLILQQSANPVKNLLMQTFPNLFQILPIFVLEKKS